MSIERIALPPNNHMELTGESVALGEGSLMGTADNLRRSFLLLQQEGYLISSSLGTGLTELRAAHVHNKGGFYSGLFNLTIGLERLLKAIVIIDHMIENSLTPPSTKELKRYGHDIIELHDTCARIGERIQVAFPKRATLDEIDREILDLVSEFAKSTRYHNLDALTSSKSQIDPLKRWGDILLRILAKDVSQLQRERILTQGEAVGRAIEDITMTVMHGLDQSPLSTIDALTLPGLHDTSARYAILRIVKLLSPCRELIGDLSRKSYSLGTPTQPFPLMHEFIDWLWADRQYVLRKKRWP